MNYLYVLFVVTVVYYNVCDANCLLSRCRYFSVSYFLYLVVMDTATVKLKIHNANAIKDGVVHHVIQVYLVFSSFVIETCILGKSWFYDGKSNFTDQPMLECSGVGVCDKGKCDCQKGFAGNACQRMACPINPKNGLPCSGKGVCITMNQHSKTNYRYPNYFEYI